MFGIQVCYAHHRVDGVDVLEAHGFESGICLQSSPQRTWSYHLQTARNSLNSVTPMLSVLVECEVS